MKLHAYYVYMMSSRENTALYTGVTGNLKNRVNQHKELLPGHFTSKYKCTKLVYYEKFGSINKAITREKQLKKWNRKWKERLINEINPNWHDLSSTI